jgi:signal peptidase I
LGKLLSAIRKKLKWGDPFTYVDLYVMPLVNPRNDKGIELAVNVVFAALFAVAVYALAGILLSTSVPGAIVYSDSMVPALQRGDFIAMSGVAAAELNAPSVDLNFAIGGKELKAYATTYCSFREGYASFGSPDEVKPCDVFLKAFREGKMPVDSFNTSRIVFRNGRTLDITAEGDTVLYLSDISGKQIIHRAVAKIRAQDGVFVLTKGDSGKNPLIDQDYPLFSREKAITSSATPADEIKGRIILRIPLLGYPKLLLFDDLPCFIFGPAEGQLCTFP